MSFAKTFSERPTFDSLLGGKGIEIAESHRKWLELEKDYRLQAFVNAQPEELHSQYLLHFQALRREQHVRAQAFRTGQDLGDVHLQQGPPRKMSNSSNVTDSDEFENSINNSRVADLMKQRDLALAKEAQNRRRRQEFNKELNYPHTLAEKRFVKFGGELGGIGGGLTGAAVSVVLVDNVEALQDPIALSALQTNFGAGFRYAGQKTGEKVASDIVKAKRVIQEKVTPEFYEGYNIYDTAGFL